MEVVCPIDGKDDRIEAVSAVVAKERGYGPVHDPNGYSYTGRFSSDLAGMLQAPIQPASPRTPSTQWFLVLFGMILLGLPLAFVACNAATIGLPLVYKRPAQQGWMSLIAVIVILGVVVFYAVASILMIVLANWYRKNQLARDTARYARELPAWEAAMERWRRLYYCHRHGLVFDPDTGKTCQPQEMKQFLYKTPK